LHEPVVSDALEIVRPSRRLARFVDEVRVLRPVHAGRMKVERIPDGSASLLLRRLGRDTGDLSVAGPRTRALFKTAPPAELAILFRFPPGAAQPLFGVPLSALTDRIVHLEELWKGDATRLLEASLSAPSADAALAAIEDAIWRRAIENEERASVRLARRAMRRLADHAGSLRVDRVASDLGVTDRHLRRAFQDAVGLGPKEVARMIRLHRALALLSPDACFSEVAADAGYYDQSHLVAEFRELLGFTPSAWLRRSPDPALQW
jgi:AraC-like DNA-binding protein